jgi:GNAT superfamily N-acetyltransferase
MDATCTAAAAADLPALLEMMRDYYAYDRIPFDEGVARAALANLLGDPSLGRIFLIRAEDEIAGYIVLTFDYGIESGGREVFIDELYLREPARGRGLGGAALRFIESVAREWGMKAIHLGVEVANRRAQAVYRRSGFGEPTRYLMTKKLQAS